MSAREPGVGDPVLDRLEGQRGDDDGGEHRHQHRQRLPAAGGEHHRADEHAERGSDADVAGCRLQHQAEARPSSPRSRTTSPQRRGAAASSGSHPAGGGPLPARPAPARPRRRARTAPRPGRGGAPPRAAGSTRSSPSRPGRRRSSAPSAAPRCAPPRRRSPAAIVVSRSCVSPTAAPARLSALPSSRMYSCSSPVGVVSRLIACDRASAAVGLRPRSASRAACCSSGGRRPR